MISSYVNTLSMAIDIDIKKERCTVLFLSLHDHSLLDVAQSVLKPIL